MIYTCCPSSSYICESFDPLLSLFGDSFFEGDCRLDPRSFDEPVDGERSFLFREFEFDLSRLDNEKEIKTYHIYHPNSTTVI